MASTLAAQLQAAKALQGDAPGAKKVRGKPSLLFDFQKAADVDLQTLYEIGCQGAHVWKAITTPGMYPERAGTVSCRHAATVISQAMQDVVT